MTNMEPRECCSRECCSRVTPPEQLPPTPPATEERRRLDPDASTGDSSTVNEAVQLLNSYRRLAQSGGLGPWTEIKLSPPLFNKLRDTIVRSFRRFDYEPGKGRLTIRMPTGVHEYFIAFLTKHIWNWIEGIAEQEGQAGIFASNIASGNSSDIFLDDNNATGDDIVPGSRRMQIKREPDGQFQHYNVPYPGVVIEVSYSQDGKRLRKLAEDYVLGSNGAIKVVVGININYRGSREATVSLWHARIDEHQVLEAEKVISYQPFRSADGLATGSDSCLTLRLSDFAPNELSADFGYEPVSLSIPFSRLADFLHQAEAIVQVRQRQRDIASMPRMRKRRQSSSSADELRSEDETKYVAREKAAVERTAADDDDYRPPATKRRG